MIKLVHEQSDRDVRMQDVRRALARMTAQLMRLAGGAGSMYRFEKELWALLGAVRELPPGSERLQDHEALRFTRSQEHYDEIEYARDQIVKQAMRLAASRIEAITCRRTDPMGNLPTRSSA